MEYIAPNSLLEITKILMRLKGKATLIAGGTNVIPRMRTKAIKSDILIDINRLKNLSFIKEEKNRIRIGGLTTIAALATSKVIQKHAPILFDAANQLGNPLVRNRATIAGNLADASPAADIAVPLLALEAKVVTVRSGKPLKEIPLDQFFLGPNQTVLRKDEIIKEVTFPRPNSKAKMAYVKLGLRNAMAISVVSLAVMLEVQGNHCKKARIGLGAVAPTPIRAYQTEAILIGEKVTTELINICSKKVLDEISPITDIRASAEYRREMTSTLFRRLGQKVTL
jgi:CO/xanthine dehydrogenase FAD-binding subunit